jgi:transcriptional regulator with XRE-family HTH domain
LAMSPILLLIREARQKRGWSQRELARRAGVRQATVSQLERGVRRLDLDVLERVARALGVPANRLLRATSRPSRRVAH